MGALRVALGAAALLWNTAAAASPVDRWAPEIKRASARSGIPATWIRRVMRAESGGRTDAGGRPIVSAAGAMGLMQLMPGTWRDMRSLLGLGADPFDPADNILAGAAYLRLMYDRFGYPGLFAAYNAGPARYAGFLAGRNRLPDETRSYVAAVASQDSARIAAGSPAVDASAATSTSANGAIASRHGFAASSAGLFVTLGDPQQQ